MPDCVFKDLVIDVEDASVAAGFWAAALGLTANPADPSPDAVLTDDIAEHTVWINQVNEPRTVKQRVHLDLLVGDPAEVTDLGATVDSVEHDGWTVMRDPEGGEFCIFFRDPASLPRYRIHGLVVDAVDPERICRWWGDRLGLTAQYEEIDPWWWLEGAQLPWPMVFAPVPEPKLVKNRIHWDVQGETADLLAAGATLLRERNEEHSWDVLADPEGNEFCVFARE